MDKSPDITEAPSYEQKSLEAMKIRQNVKKKPNTTPGTPSSHSSLPPVNIFPEVSGLFSSSSGSLKPLKVKSRWRYSLDAENIKSSDASNGNSAESQMYSLGNGLRESNTHNATSLGNSHIQNSFEMSLKDRNLVRKSGHIVYEATDSELEDKVKNFEGVDENLFYTYEKISNEGRVKDQEKVKEKPKAERKRRKEVQFEDMAFEEELGKLELSGLKNRHHTLTLSRLMVRAEDWDTKERLLKILVNGDKTCRRLFLDYHGLRIIWCWMVNLALPDQGSELELIRNDQCHMMILKALASLRIPNKAVLHDSKVLTLVEKWSNSPPSSIISTAPKPDSSEAAPKDGKNLSFKAKGYFYSESNSDVNVKVSPESPSADQTSSKTAGGETVEAVKAAHEELKWEFVSVAKSLLECWTDLKEVFRIPKKERVEQMKEQKREADKVSGHNDRSVSRGYERDSRKHSRSKERRHVVDSSEHMPTYHRSSIKHTALSPPKSKEQRRLIFTAKVARQEIENKRRREQDDMVNLHQERCAALGLDASTTPIVDPSGSYYWDPNTISWIEIKVDDPNLPSEIPIVQATLYPPPLFEMLTPEPQVVVPPGPYGLPPPPPVPPATLPPRWKMAVDDEGRCYYYDVKTRHTQWYTPSPPSGEGYGSKSSCSSDSEDADEKEVVEECATVVGQIHFQTKRSKLNERAEKRKKAGLVQERVISPRLDDERPAVNPKSIGAPEIFRSQIANFIVTLLNPYRKPDCKHGRIASTDDFKHLARKMTHTILMKEQKHTRNAKLLEVNDSVRNKTKKYIKTFMARFANSNYARSPGDAPLLNRRVL